MVERKIDSIRQEGDAELKPLLEQKSRLEGLLKQYRDNMK
jgi:hypothetical protein